MKYWKGNGTEEIPLENVSKNIPGEDNTKKISLDQ